MIPKEVYEKYHLADISEYESEILFYKTFLVQTDHIPLKIFESFIENMATASLAESFVAVLKFFKDVKLTYAYVLTARKQAREEINRIESKQATE